MNEHAILGQLVLGHSLMLDRERRVVATRLTVFPERRDASHHARNSEAPCHTRAPSISPQVAPPEIQWNGTKA